MKRKYYALFVLIAASLAQAQELPVAAPADPPLAMVNGKAISQRDVEQYRALHPTNASQMQPRRIVEEIIRRHLLVGEAAATGLDKDLAFIAQRDELLTNFLADFTMQRFLETHPVQEEEMQKAYADYVAQAKVPTEFKVRHIQVDNEDKAKEIIKLLGEGKDFAALAKERSEDKGSQADGGALGWLNGHMLAMFNDALKPLTKGGYTLVPVKSDFGWHVLLLEDQRAMAVPPYDNLKPVLQRELANRALLQYLDGLRQKAKIEMLAEPK